MKNIILVSLFGMLMSLNLFAAKEKYPLVDAAELSKIVSENKGSPIVLNYWASWCSSCKPNLKFLADLQKKYKSKGLKVIGVSVDGPDDEVKLALVKFLYQESGAYYKQLITKISTETKDIMTVVDKEWLEIVPVSYFIDKHGKIVKRFVGSRSMKDLEFQVKQFYK